MSIDQFLELLAEQQLTRPPGWRLDKRRRIRDAECRCPVESLAYYAIGANGSLPYAFTVWRPLGLDLTAFALAVAAADGGDFASRPIRQRMLAICGLEAA